MDPQLSMDEPLFFRKCLSASATTFLLWDTLCTLPEEVQYFWRAPKTAVSYLFFVYRYSAVADVVTMSVADFTELSEGGCKIYNLVHQVLLAVVQGIVSILLGLRIYALYNGKTTIAALLALAILACVAATLWGFLAQRPQSDPLTACFDTSGVDLMASWIALLGFDCLIFFLTLARTLTERRRMANASNLRYIIVRDGASYFIMMAVANLVNIFSFVFQRGIMRGFFSTYANSIAVVFMTRLLINLRRAMHKCKTQALVCNTATTGASLPALSFAQDELGFHIEVDLIEETQLGNDPIAKGTLAFKELSLPHDEDDVFLDNSTSSNIALRPRGDALV